MFRLHDKTRRRICLTGFFLLCVAPVVGAAAWCALRHAPWVVEDEARNLARRLGLEVHLAGIKNLQPGTVLYEGLELADPETKQSLLRCRLLEVQWKTIAGEHGVTRPMLLMQAWQPEVDAAGLLQLGALLQRAMQGQTGGPAVDMRVSAGELTIRAGPGSQTFIGVDGSFDNPPGGVQAVVTFRIPGIDMHEPVRIRAVRNRQTSPPASGFELSTGDGCLSCDLLAAGLPELGGLGSRCVFRGLIWANQDYDSQAGGAWTGEANGQLLGVDLDRLVSGHFPHKLSGAGDVTIRTASFIRGRLERASGTIIAGPGVISRSLLLAAARHLHLASGTDLDLIGDLVTYDRIALDVCMDAAGLRILGQCSATGKSLLLAGPQSQTQPVAAIIQTLVPESAFQVPATDQTDWLVAHLAMPQAVAPQTRQATTQSGQLRLRKE
jgi:hypothetical protein